jgi:hypothetical protein
MPQVAKLETGPSLSYEEILPFIFYIKYFLEKYYYLAITD